MPDPFHITTGAWSGEEPPAGRIPVRYWPNPHGYVLGHLTLDGEPIEDGELVHYRFTFQPGPLRELEKPAYDLRIAPGDADV